MPTRPRTISTRPGSARTRCLFRSCFTNRWPDANAYCYAYSDCYGYANSHRNHYAERYSYRYAKADAHAAIRADAQTASHSGAKAVITE